MKGEVMSEALELFVEEHCVGKEYDSCVNSPCRYSSNDGCTHPKHPKFHSLREKNQDLTRQVVALQQKVLFRLGRDEAVEALGKLSLELGETIQHLRIGWDCDGSKNCEKEWHEPINDIAKRIGEALDAARARVPEVKSDCAKCHVEDSEFCDEVNVALAALRADAKRLKADLADALIKEAEAFRLGEKAVLGLMEERDAVQARLKQAEEANKNLMEEHQALVRNAAVERKELRAAIDQSPEANDSSGLVTITPDEVRRLRGIAREFRTAHRNENGMIAVSDEATDQLSLFLDGIADRSQATG